MYWKMILAILVKHGLTKQFLSLFFVVEYFIFYSIMNLDLLDLLCRISLNILILIGKLEWKSLVGYRYYCMQYTIATSKCTVCRSLLFTAVRSTGNLSFRKLRHCILLLFKTHSINDITVFTHCEMEWL